MSDYSTIQQHAPLRVPEGWSRQERAFVVQLEEILDDIYRRFGRLRPQDMGKELKGIIESVDGLSYTKYEADMTGIRTEVGKKVDNSTLANYSTTEQTATQINTKVSNALQDYSTTSQTAQQINTKVENALQNYSTTSQTASQIDSKVSNALQDYSTTAQTATQIDSKVSNALQDYSTTTQTATQISQYVSSNAYAKASGVAISAAGVDLTGAKHINLDSGEINVGEWKFSQQYGLFFQKESDHSKYLSIQYPSSQNKLFIETDTTMVFSIGETGAGISLRDTGTQSGKEKIALEPYQSPNTTLVSLGSWDNHVDQVCTDYLYYWNGGMQSSRDSKRDIRLLESCGGKIDQLKPVRFKYKGDDRERIGLIYEEAVDVVPEICSEYDGAKAIDYAGLVPMLLKEIQSLRARVAELEKKR